MTAPAEGQAGQFAPCAGCPAVPGCVAASYCVIECRFHQGEEITAPTCGTCGRSAAQAWACPGSGDPAKACDAMSETWGAWFLVQMYAVDEQRRRAGEAAAVADVDDENGETCYHEHDEDCYDYQGFYACRHYHCIGCGGCQCPGYCDDYQTYNLRPAETGGESE